MTQRTCGVTIDSLGVFCEIVCAQRLHSESTPADKAVPVNVAPLVGWHESYLNSATYAFECALIADWIDFLSGDWADVLRFDKYPALCDVIRKSLFSDKGMIAVLDKVMENAESTDDNSVVSQARRMIIGDRGMYIDENTKNMVITYTIDFLRKNKSLFPKLFIPMPKDSKGKPKK